MKKYIIFVLSLLIFNISHAKWDYFDERDKVNETTHFYIGNENKDGFVLLIQSNEDEFFLVIGNGRQVEDGSGDSYILIDDGPPEKFAGLLSEDVGVTRFDKENFLKLIEKMKKGNQFSVLVQNENDSLVMEIDLNGFTEASSKFENKIK